jgi:hypothetical protein
MWWISARCIYTIDIYVRARHSSHQSLMKETETVSEILGTNSRHIYIAGSWNGFILCGSTEYLKKYADIIKWMSWYYNTLLCLFCKISCWVTFPQDRAIAQAVSRRFPTAAARVQTRVSSCWILWWTKVVLEQVFSENFGFPYQSTFHLLLHNHLHYHPRLAQ